MIARANRSNEHEEQILAVLSRRGRQPAGSGSEPSRAVQCLLASDGPFAEPLSEIYGADIAGGFRWVLQIRRLAPGGAFLASPGYRRRALAALARHGLPASGLLALHPAAVRCAELDGLALCHLFGSLGWAQLCDPSLGSPRPLLVQPWSDRHGLLEPRRPPRQAFSRALAVRPIGPRRMLLMDRRAFG